MAGSDAGAFDRALSFLHDLDGRRTHEHGRWSWGRAFFHPRFPTKWDLNFLSIDDPVAPEEVGALAAEAETLFTERGLEHRKLHVDFGWGESLVAPFDEIGWSADRLQVMTLEDDPAATGEENRVEEMDRQAMLAPTRDWYLRTLNISREGATRLAESLEATERAISTRYLAIRERRRVVSWCHLYAGDGVAQIEEVSTFPDARRRGYGRAVVRRAIQEARAAGADLVFLVADCDDWPRELYERMGFKEAGRIYEFTKLPGIYLRR